MPDYKLTRRDAGAALLIALVTFFLYWQVRVSEFVSLDDTDYVTQNAHVNTGLTWSNIAWAFTSGHASNWHPLTWISLMLDCQLFGMNFQALHLINVILHIAASLLLFVFLRRATGTFWRCAFVAALFAWHPAHVESVAWVSERKDVLSALFFMLTLLAYHEYAKRPSLKFYVTSLQLFALGLMAKPMLVTLPFVLILLDVWPLRRLVIGGKSDSSQIAAIPLRRIIMEKAPFLVLSLASCRITYAVQSAGGSTAALGIIPMKLRLFNAAISCCCYLGKLFCPVNLAAFYPYDMSPKCWLVGGSIFILAAITVCAILQFRRFPFLAVGWLWFLGMLVPVIGIIQVGQQSMADRYTYLPSIGIFFGITWMLAELSTNRATLITLFSTAAVAALIACLALTPSQVGFWRNSETLYRHAVEVTHENAYGEYMLAFTLDDNKEYDKAITLYKDSLRIDPTFGAAENNLARDYAMQEKFTDATNHYARATVLSPTNAIIHYNFAESLIRLNDFAGAETEYRESLKRDPAFAQARFGLGMMFVKQQQYDKAIPEMIEVSKADPTNAAPHRILGDCYNDTGNTADAIKEYQLCLKLEPTNVIVLNNLAWIYAAHYAATFRNGPEGVKAGEKACDLTEWKEPMFIGTLAAAYAEAGDFDKAVSAAQKAHDLAEAAGFKDLAATNENLLKLYQTRQPFHEKPPAPVHNSPSRQFRNGQTEDEL
jgi:tetratricopeptide (TPR) repeat protein